MRTVTVLLTGLVFTSVGVFAQGAAEAALGHALSTSMGTAAGKSLGNVTNQLSNRTAVRLGQQGTAKAPRPVVNNSKVMSVPKPGTVQPAAKIDYGTIAEPPSGGTLIQSIEGAGPESCVNVAQGPEAQATEPEAKTGDAEKIVTDPAQKPCAPSAGAFRSVINLPPAK